MNEVSYLAWSESVWLDRDQLAHLYQQLGVSAAENVVCRSMEELAVRLSFTERLHRQGDMANMRKSLNSLAAIADQIGMTKLVRVSGDVGQCIEDGDGIAVAATLGRLLRIGERSLTEVWDLQDLSL